MGSTERRRRRRRRRKNRKKLFAVFLILTAAALFIVGSSAGMRAHDGSDAEIDTDATQTEPEAGSQNEPQNEPQTGSQTEPQNEADAWNLLLVNPWNRLPDDHTVELAQLGNGHAIDARAYDDLQEMLDAARGEGLSPLICSSYRTSEKQQALYDKEVKGQLSKGYSQEAAEAEAAKWVALPGTSEHQTGLAVDIVDLSYQLLDEGQEKTPVQKWLMENSYKYGFILRYPSDKSSVTGIGYEPWHYRYVGKEAASEIYEKGICLEEYLGG